MQFQPGHKLAKGGARPGAGRPPKGKQTAAEIVRAIIESNAEKLSSKYIDRALGQFGDRVLCHAIDKLLPEIKLDASSRPIAIQVVIETSSNGNGRAHVDIEGEGSSRSILIGGD